jgi:hypothetical protein
MQERSDSPGGSAQEAGIPSQHTHNSLADTEGVFFVYRRFNARIGNPARVHKKTAGKIRVINTLAPKQTAMAFVISSYSP